MPVIDEVGGEQIVVAEHDVDRTDGGFEPCGAGKKIVEDGKVAAVAFAQRVPVVAHDMEHPEHDAGPAQELRNVAVTPPHHVDQALEICRIAYVLRREGASLDEIEHENARLGVHHARAQARQMRRPARGQLVRPHHAVNRDIAADPHDVAAAAILDREVLIGDAAGERHRLHAPEPDLKLGHARR